MESSVGAVDKVSGITPLLGLSGGKLEQDRVAVLSDLSCFQSKPRKPLALGFRLVSLTHSQPTNLFYFLFYLAKASLPGWWGE